MSLPNGLHHIIDDTKKRREQDKDRFENQDGDLCMLCHAYGSDKRSLFIDCFYNIGEVLPEALDIHLVEGQRGGWYLRICKHCRGEFLGMLGEWREKMIARRVVPKDHDGNGLWDDDPELNIPVRVNGTTVMMTADQYEEWKAKQNRTE